MVMIQWQQIEALLKAACQLPLHTYVSEKGKAASEPHLFHQMMKLCIHRQSRVRTQYDMADEANRIPLMVLFYSLCMSACAKVTGAVVTSAERVYEELTKYRNVEVGWSSHSTLANIITRSVLVEKTFAPLVFVPHHPLIKPSFLGFKEVHTITGLTVALKQATNPEHKAYQEQVLRNCSQFDKTLNASGYDLVSGEWWY
ncbi:uncharacterized protein LOC113311367 [Papaver somniferum]|uniref:uncharacterized protein LOC113311367 n=1 Tax=Papaver somniferum TaxID=3469 RepID=UPI000E6FECEB|nr:uncharacterized protein LOC113311367 [Papaver somniferum]XP_026415998.1 uncharacterized protein LOC113311367 [Papaver somniferum]